MFGYPQVLQQNDLDYREVLRSGVTHLILFSLELDPIAGSLTAVERGLPRDGKFSQSRREAAEEGAKIMVCVGAGCRSARFAGVARDKIKRNEFLNELNTLLLGRKLAGVDFNWERPVDDIQW